MDLGNAYRLSAGADEAAKSRHARGFGRTLPQKQTGHDTQAASRLTRACVKPLKILASALAWMSLSVAAASAAELIVNGGFELGNFAPIGGGITNYDLITGTGPQDLTGWRVGNSLVWGMSPPDINPHSGQGFVDLTGVGDTTPHGSLLQSIATIVGQTYAFSIFATQDFRGALGFDVFANGTALGLTGTPGFWDYSPTGATYGQLTSRFVADATTTQIGIFGRASTAQRFMIGLDDVSVTGPANPSPVPLPASLPLLLMAVGAFAFLRSLRAGRHARSGRFDHATRV